MATKTSGFTLTDWIWVVLISFLALGWFYPTIGLIAVICMAAPVVYGLWKGGRVWCGSFCPRGNFLGKIIANMSSKGKMPALLSNKWFRYGVMVFLLSYFTYGVSNAWGNSRLVGLVFLRTILITTIVAVGLGIKYQPRTWCGICPMGTLGTFASAARKRLTTDKKKEK